MFKRIGFFLVTNLAIILTIQLILELVGAKPWMTRSGIDYQSLAVFCLIYGMVGSFISLQLSKFSAKMMYGVKIINPDQPGQYSELVQMIRRLTQSAGLPKLPEIGVYNSPEVNAFATGPSQSRALVAVSQGLLNTMDRNQIEAVMAHEIAHIKNGDMVTMALIQGVINAFVMFFARILAFVVSQAIQNRNSDDGEASHSPWLQFILVEVFSLLFGFLGMMVVCYFSRQREFRADRGAGQYAGREKMISALEALGSLSGRRALPATQADALAVYKISGGRSRGIGALFMTHPPIEERIKALQSFAT